MQVKGDGSTRFPTVDDLGVEIVWCTLVDEGDGAKVVTR